MTETRILKRLTPQQIQSIRNQRMHFRRAEELTGVPWRAVATIWYRESFSVAPPTNRVGGQFQFDPPLTTVGMRALLNKYTLPGKLTEAEKAEIIRKGQEHFPSAAILAACFLRHKANPVLTPQSPDKDIADAFYGYNGRAYKSADKSPYVMNYADFDHYEMRIYGTVKGKDGKNIRLHDTDGSDGKPNKQIGALVVYQQLKAAIDG